MTEATDDLRRLGALAASLRPRLAPEKPLPRLLFLTDPQRTPDPLAVVERLPAGWGVIYRSFGAADEVETARRLRKATSARGLTLLVTVDERLATACAADGVHLPEGLVDKARLLRDEWPNLIVTTAAHSAYALTLAAENGCHAALLSPVFPSLSPSAGRPLGVETFTGLVAAAALPVYALGGVNAKTAPELLSSGAAGFAMVGGASA